MSTTDPNEQDEIQDKALGVRAFLQSHKVKSILYVGGDDRNGTDFRFYFESGVEGKPLHFFTRLENRINQSMPKRTRLLRFVPPRRRPGETGDRILSPEDCTPLYGFQSRDEEQQYLKLVEEKKQLRRTWARTRVVLNGIRNQDPRVLSVLEGMVVGISVPALMKVDSQRPEASDSDKLEFLSAESILRALREGKRETHSRQVVRAVLDEYFPRIGLEHLNRESVEKRVRSRMGYHLPRLRRMNPGKRRGVLEHLKSKVASFKSSHLK